VQDGRRISFCVNDLAFAERYRKSLYLATGLDAEIDEIQVPSGFLQRNVTMFRVRVVSRHLGSLMLSWFGGSKATKEFHFPRVVLRSEEMMRGFLDGYCDGDGSLDRRAGSRTIVSANRQFLSELGEVLATRWVPRRQGTATLRVSKHWAEQGWYGKPGFSPQQVELLPSDAAWTPVDDVDRRVAKGTKPFTVYSYQCHPHPTFLVAGVLTHNCEHHLIPFVGRAHVGYVPNERGQVTGLSKLARLVDVIAKQPNLQERITSRVADTLEQALSPRGVIVVIEAEHLCMTMRGVRKPGAMTVTSAVRGLIRDDPRSRAEAMALVLGSRSAHG
jgi:GTP cyclohydrolase I